MASVASTSGDDVTAAAEALGMARGQKTNNEAWQRGTTHTVVGKHGHPDGLPCGKTKARREKIVEDHGRPWMA